MTPPLVSVGIPTYNNPLGLRDALYSITHQYYENLEIIISNDKSPNPETDVVINEFKSNDSRIRSFTQYWNLGVHKNLIFLLGEATGKYFMYAQDDDWWSQGFIEQLVKALEENPLAPVAISKVRFMEPGGKLVGNYTMKTASPYSAICNEQMGFIYMGLWRLESLRKYESEENISVIGGDMIVVAEAMLATTQNIPVVETELYMKGLDHDKIKNWFWQDPLCHCKSYYHLLKTLTFSQYIPRKKKLLIPAIAASNLFWLGRAYAAQVLFLLPTDHPLRKMVRKK